MANTCKFIPILLLIFIITIASEECTNCRYAIKKFLVTFKNYSVITQMNPEEKFEMLIKKTIIGKNQAETFENLIPKLKSWFLEESEKNLDSVEDRICIPDYCCPKFHFGPECKPCNPCNSEGGYCDGSGLKFGTGKCKCRNGYLGEECDQCNLETHFKSEENGSCQSCDVSCADGCTGGTNKDCKKCAKGFEYNEDDQSCQDIDECSLGNNKCDSSKYFCMNTPGSFQCKNCNRACSGCYTAGPENCIDCAPGYEYDGEKCVDINECEHLPCVKQNQECVNTPGSYECQCAKGFEKFEEHCIKRPSGDTNKDSSVKKKPKIIWTVKFCKEFCKMITSLLVLAVFSKIVKGYPPIVVLTGLINGYYVFNQSINLDEIYNSQK